MKTLNDIVVDIQFSFSDEPFKLSVHYESKEYHSRTAIFDSVFDGSLREWSFKRIYGECHVTRFEVDFRKFQDSKNRIKLYLLMEDTTKIRAKKQATSDK